MNTKSKFEILLKITLVILFVLPPISALKSQEKLLDELKEFKIIIEKTENGLKMKSNKGSAWTDLSFSLTDNQPQAINEYGMTELGKVSADKHSKLGDYLFTVTKTKEGITLAGLEGTAWKALSFSLKMNGRQAIDQLGMTK